ncbi:MAG TPA: D-alanyl-D-alanine carboxypeptidase/D-alanyl-D-alanine-endopeptidase [Flavisolibacter sp.]|nr:D-alanyl-D-alanine carboxypeptidase/D-alanyl-D-alanine-endopeptidase [Flavisolibacter sp.]
MKKLLLLSLLLAYLSSFSQSVPGNIEKAFRSFENDSQLKHAIASLYVIEEKTGKVVFEKNAGIGLAPASTQKLITGAACYELLGSNFVYSTIMTTNGKVERNILKGDLFIKGMGDPTFGSWRYQATKKEAILNGIVSKLRSLNIKQVQGALYLDESSFSYQPTPGGWIWDDIGNYYGAGSRAINWNENQYDLVLQPGKKPGDTTSIIIKGIGTSSFQLHNGIKTGNKGSGDNGYIYLAPYGQYGFTTGTIPQQDKSFTISGSLPYPALSFAEEIESSFQKANIIIQKGTKLYTGTESFKLKDAGSQRELLTFHSPSLDSMIYWFFKKSINLYGEAFVKTLAFKKEGFGETETGVDIIRNFWKGKGIEITELNMVDGSGLSPLNRVTTHAQVTVLQYAKKQNWFPGFYDALPEYNKMKMKSGTINAAKGFCGYQHSSDGNDYIFSFLVNNYNGSASALVQKMYKVLDELK